MTDLAAVIDEVTSEVLETMFFSDPVGAPGVPINGECLLSMVSFSGARSGSMALCTGPAAARSLTASFMGADEDAVSSEDVEGVVRELANIVCGGVLERLDTDGRFDISSPLMVESALVSELLTGMQTRRTFEIERGLLAVGLNIAEAS